MFIIRTFGFGLACFLWAGCQGALPESSEGGGGPGAGQSQSQPDPAEVAGFLDMVARKSYGPSSWVDQNTVFTRRVRILLPGTIPVTQGRSGNHWVTLTLFQGQGEFLCYFRGAGSVSRTGPPCGNNGTAYNFDFCVSRATENQRQCGVNPNNCRGYREDMESQDPVDVDRMLLSVKHGDVCSFTEVSVRVSVGAAGN